MFDRSDIDRVREMTDLAVLVGEHVVLTPRGHEHIGLCPFHEDTNPSFAVVTHKGNHFYKCHSCGASGDCFRFVQEHLQKSFTESVEFLAERVGMTLQRSGRPDEEAGPRADRRAWLRKASIAARDFFRETLDNETGSEARKTFEQRGISREMVDRFELGASPPGWDGLLRSLATPDLPAKVLVAAGLLKQRQEGDGHYDAFRNRLIFPIHDDTGTPIAFGARALTSEDQPKYLNSSEHDLFHKGRTLYGLHLARPAIVKAKEVIVTEGYTDVIACHAAGFKNTVGTLGTALTDEHVRKLARICDSIVLLFDGDEAGQRAAERAVRTVFKHPVDVRICVLPDGLDPDDLLARPNGAQRFTQHIRDSADALDYLLERFTSKLDGVSGLSARQRILEQFIDLLRGLGLEQADGLRRSMLVNRIGELMNVPARDIEAVLKRRRPVPNSPDEAVATTPALESSSARQVAERNVLAIILHRSDCFDEVQLTVHDVLASDRFTDSASSRVAGVLSDLLAAGRPTMQSVLEHLEHEHDRELASRLYFTGERLFATISERSEDIPLQYAHQVLDECIDEQQRQHQITEYLNRDDADERTPADVIKHLGSRRRRPAAILRSNGGD